MEDIISKRPSKPVAKLLSAIMKSNKTVSKNDFFNRSYLLLSAVSLASLAATFLVSNADLTYRAKLATFASIIVFYLLLCAGIYLRQIKQLAAATIDGDSDSPFNSDIETKLLALEEANQFFGASLKSADMFRLIASRVNEMIPNSACAFYTIDEAQKKLKMKYAVGDELKKLIGVETDWQTNLAGKCFHSREPQIDRRIIFEQKLLAEANLGNLHSAIAVPLVSGEKVFGVFALYGEQKDNFSEDSLPLFEAVASRIAPLFLSSQAFESNLTNALTDALTNLPNERGFFLVLENQIAESQRFRDERPLTILAIDIRNFGEHNRNYGHATGDRLLLFAADKIKNQLRQMDFLARVAGDEFLAVLPTASEETTREIIERVERIFVTNPFEIAGQEKIHLQLNFGAASFGKDGETANQLLKHAVLRKQQSKSENKDNKILWFPKEYVN